LAIAQLGTHKAYISDAIYNSINLNLKLLIQNH